MKVILLVLPNKTSFRTIGPTLDRLEELFLTMKEATGYMKVMVMDLLKLRMLNNSRSKDFFKILHNERNKENIKNIYIYKNIKKNIWGKCGVLGPRTAFS